MKILLDEDTPVQLVDVLRHLLAGHRVDHVARVRWNRKPDLNLLPDAARRNYDAILTIDANQLDDPDEVSAIRKSRMHHVRFAQRHPGVSGLAIALGSVFAAMPLVVAELEEASGQRIVQIKGIDPTPSHRYEMVDPLKDPPKYWPR